VVVLLIRCVMLLVHKSHSCHMSHRISEGKEGIMTLIRSTSFTRSCAALRSGGDCGREEGSSFLVWHDLDVVVLWVVLCWLLAPWFVASNRSVPDCPFFRRLHVSAVWSFFDIKLRNVNIRSP